MVDFPSPFSGGDSTDTFDEYDEYVPEHLPDPGPFLSGHRVLERRAHVAVHERARELFEERGVYDVTFDYNLARLNLDSRHPDAGYRYAADAGDPGALRAEFTPTTPFCPQSESLTVASFRAWNGLSDRHDHEVVRVRVHPSHQRSEAINAVLEELEARFRETGSVPEPSADLTGPDPGQRPPDAPF